MAKKVQRESKTYYFELCEKDNSQIMTKEGATGFPALFELLARCVTKYKDDEGNEAVQTIRYIEGETDVRISHQRKDILKNQEKPLVFRDGGMVVSEYEPLKLEYMLSHPQFEGNPNKDTRKPILFKEIDKAKIKKEALRKEETKIEADALVLDMFKNDPSGAISFCEAVGVNTEQDAELMKHDLLIRVRRNPALFVSQLQDPTLKKKAFVHKAIKQGVLKISSNSVTWGDGSSTGFTCPIGSNVEEEFINWFEDTKGKKVYSQIKFRLENPIEVIK
jgi:hypothetical protein